MRRLVGAWRVLCSLSVVPAATAVLVAGPARAATITEVADAAEPDKPVDLNLDFKWIRSSHSASITREFTSPKNGSIYDASELSYSHVRNTIQLGGTVGMWHDLELHFVVPYVVSDTQNWQYAVVNGQSVAASSTIANNNRDAGDVGTQQNTLPTTPLFQVPGTVNRGGFGDPTLGLAWGIFNEARDAHLPNSWYPNASRTATWVVGLDYTMPLAPVMDPSVTNPGSPNSGSLPVGQGAHRLDFWTSMSKRFGVVEPFFRLHYTLALAASNAYDNCSIETTGADGGSRDPNHMVLSQYAYDPTALGGTAGACNPKNPDQFWAGRTKLEPSQVGGFLFGTEFHPVDHGKSGLGLAIAIQFSGDYVSKGRNYSELADVMHKLTYTDQYFALDSRLLVDFRFSKYVHWVSYASLGTDTTHLLTAEVVGIPRSTTGYVNLGDQKANEVNPSYDFRTDAPGGRFKATAVTNFVASTALSVNF